MVQTLKNLVALVVLAAVLSWGLVWLNEPVGVLTLESELGTCGSLLIGTDEVQQRSSELDGEFSVPAAFGFVQLRVVSGSVEGRLGVLRKDRVIRSADFTVGPGRFLHLRTGFLHALSMDESELSERNAPECPTRTDSVASAAVSGPTG